MPGGSVVWGFFTKLNSEEEKVATCNLCHKRLSYASTTSNLKTHLKNRHIGTYKTLTEVSCNYVPNVTSRGSVVWDFFTKLNGEEEKVATCNLCHKRLSYASTTSNLKTHLRNRHVGTYRVLTGLSSSMKHDPGSSAIPESNSASMDVDIDGVKPVKPFTLTNTIKTESASFTNFPSTSSYSEVGFCGANTGTHSGSVASTSSFSAHSSGASSTDIDCGSDSDDSEVISNFSTKTSTTLFQTAQLSKKLKRLTKKQKQIMDRDFLDVFILDFQPFRFVEKVGIRKFFKKHLPEYKLPSRKRISNSLVPSLYYTCLDATKKLVREEAESICITSDCWTSKANDTYMALTGHYVSKDFALKSILLTCSKLPCNHTASDVASEVGRIIDNWELRGKVNFSVSDNAPNMVNAFEGELNWKHYSCYAQKLNVIVQSALQLEPVNEVLDKVKTIVTHFGNSSLSDESVLEHHVNNFPTRWNSTFYMMKRLIELEVAIRASVTVMDEQFPSLAHDDWVLLKHLIRILRPFEQITKEMSDDKYCTGSSVIAFTRTLKVSCEILGKLELTALARQVLERLETGISLKFKGVEVLETFALTTLLDPRYKDRLFEDKYASDYAKQNLERAVVNELSKEPLTKPSTSLCSEQVNEVENEGLSITNIMREIIGNPCSTAVGTPLSKAVKEIDRYFSDDCLPFKNSNGQPNNPLDWWKDNQIRYPTLATLVRNKFNVLASSVSCERVFSESGNLVSDWQTSFTSEKVEMIMFLHENYDFCRSLEMDSLPSDVE